MIENIIWQTSTGDCTQFELQYIREFLFKDLKYNPIFDGGKCETILNNSLIVYSNDEPLLPKTLRDYFGRYDERKYNYYLLHLSNESLKHDFEYYSSARHVFRAYHDPRITLANTTVIPIGVKSGFLNHSGAFPGMQEKKYAWSFIGQKKNDRESMCAALASICPNYIHLTRSWNCPTSMQVNEVIDIYRKTLFIPCPAGWTNPDSFRINEALEWGCIPITKQHNGQDYFRNVYGDHPFIVVADWGQAAHTIMEMCRDFRQVVQKTAEVQAFYTGFKAKLQDKIKRLVSC